MQRLEIFLILILFCIGGCGIKGDPLPPAEQETIQKQEAAKPVAPLQTSGTSEEKKKIKK